MPVRGNFGGNTGRTTSGPVAQSTGCTAYSVVPAPSVRMGTIRWAAAAIQRVPNSIAALT